MPQAKFLNSVGGMTKPRGLSNKLFSFSYQFMIPNPATAPSHQLAANKKLTPPFTQPSHAASAINFFLLRINSCNSKQHLFPFRTTQSPLRTPQSLNRNAQSLFRTNQSLFSTNQSPLRTNQSALRTNQSPVRTNQSVLRTRQSVLRTCQCVLRTNQSALRTNHFSIRTNKNSVRNFISA